MRRPFAVGLVALFVLVTPVHADLALETIMADPDWIGPPVESPYWTLDGSGIHYSLKRAGSSIRELHRVGLDGIDALVMPVALPDLDGPDANFDRTRRRAAFARNGDIFVRTLATGKLLQITRTSQTESTPRFSADDKKLQFRSGHDWFVYDFTTGVIMPAAIVRTEKDPDAKTPDDFEQRQLRLLTTLRQDRDDRDALKRRDEELRTADPTRTPKPFFIGDDVEIADSGLSPDGTFMLIVTTPKDFDTGRSGKMPKYVTESGYEEIESTRARVGRNGLAPQTLWLLDLTKHESTKLAYADLPGIHDDPLGSIRTENRKVRIERENANKNVDGRFDTHAREDVGNKKSKERSLQVASIHFARSGTAAVMLRANDNKDRWIVSIDTDKRTLRMQHRLTDPAWINWNFCEFGLTDDGRMLWYVSEETGFAHLYAKRLDGKPYALTQGYFEVSAPELSPDGNWFYVRANTVDAPYAYDIYRVRLSGGALERITQLQGVTGFSLSPDANRVLVTHSSSYVPTQISVVPATGDEARQLTDTRTAAYRAINWLPPEIVAIPSSHGKTPIWSKFYAPANANADGKHPIVMFVHGAGYTQNTHLYFPYYFREQMFHNLLTERGYLVLDMDYRASEGYGRDWRTAIYRNMGHPELEDLIDGVNWLVKYHHGDPQHVGIYGGSYGGFMTLMAMFRAPDVFRAGAALRPVTDWSQYNHEYTSNILNTPQMDDIAYRRSSPIEFAEGLKGPLLIVHGMIDDNVFFQDSVRLYQRLIELHKDDVEIAPYPLERHAFAHSDAWLDEYKRILRLFETHLK